MKRADGVLGLLRVTRSTGVFLSGEKISEELGVSRAAVWKEIRSLREMGYQVLAQPNQGYRLVGIPDKLFSDEISAGLATRVIGNKIYSYETLDSTNDTVFRLGEEGVAEGCAVFAEHQKKGRGRLGRVWEAKKGESVLFSVLLRPNFPPSQIARITLVVALSMARAVSKTIGQTPGIKWPNDLLFSGKKICGILTEMSAETDRINFVVVGVGINVNQPAADLPENASSLLEVAGKKIDRIAFARTILEEFDRDYHRLLTQDFSELAREWEEFSVTTGQRVVARMLDRQIEGQAVGIDLDGALWIRKDNGIQERVLSGDIEHLRESHG